MVSIIDVAKKVRALDIDKMVSDIIKEDIKLYKLMNQEQLLDGEDSNEMPMRTYASEKYARIKHKMNRRAGLGTADFKLTGYNHSRIKPEVYNTNSVRFSNDDPKLKTTVMESFTHQREVYGLQPKNIQKIQRRNKRKLFKQYKDLTGL